MSGAKIEVKFDYPNFEEYSDPSFSGQIFLECKIHYIAKLTETDSLVAPCAMIRGVPFVLTVTRIKKKLKSAVANRTTETTKIKTKVDTLRFQLEVNNDSKEDWNCKFLILFRADDVNINRQFEKKIFATFKDTRRSLHYDTSFGGVASLGTFLFNVSIAAELPSSWSSMKAIKCNKYIGLRNEGATCYINSVLQSLFQIDRFRELIFNAPFDEDDVDYSFVFALKYIFYLMQNIRLPEVRTNKLINLFNWKQMTTSDQQDVHEFVRRLIEELDKYLKDTEYASFLSDLFAGQTKTTTHFGSIESAHFDVFWDLTLSVHYNGDIQDAIESYLKPEEIDDFGEKQHKVMQRREFTVLPPVLCVSLSRFRYDPKKQQINKNNKLFKFDNKLDLSEYLPNSLYSLHSVLVHSGTLNSGHYTVFINPKCENNWYKFDDEVVTKCLESNAIESNFGNRGDKNAYMLIYIKNVDIPTVLNSFNGPIRFADTIEAVIKKDQQMIESMKNQFEFIVFTPERMSSIKFKRDGKLFEARNKRTFIQLFIDRSKLVKNFYELLYETLCVSNETTHIRVLRLTSKGEIDNWKNDRLNEGERAVDPLTALENVFHHSRNFLFIQIEPKMKMEPEIKSEEWHEHEVPELPESIDDIVMIFLKHYDAKSDSILFFECAFFEDIDKMSKVYDYIRKELHLNHNVPLKVYREGGRGILLNEDQSVQFAVTDDVDIHTEAFGSVTTLVFEIGENGTLQYNAIVG